MSSAKIKPTFAYLAFDMDGANIGIFPGYAIHSFAEVFGALPLCVKIQERNRASEIVGTIFRGSR